MCCRCIVFSCVNPVSTGLSPGPGHTDNAKRASCEFGPERDPNNTCEIPADDRRMRAAVHSWNNLIELVQTIGKEVQSEHTDKNMLGLSRVLGSLRIFIGFPMISLGLLAPYAKYYQDIC